MVFLFLPSGGGKLKDQIMVQKTRIWSFKIRMRMDVSSGSVSVSTLTSTFPSKGAQASRDKRHLHLIR